MKKMDLIKKILPKTYYADRGSEERIKLFVEHWRRLVKVNQELEEKVSRVELPVKPESENKKEYLIADLMENIRHSFDGADIVIKFSITAKCKHSKRTISNQ